MDESPANIPSGKSPRRELQGPRPAPLKVNKDSHKIKKPPVAPQPVRHHQPPPRAPIIIYTVSPKIIHANPNEFMTLVQRLTGPNSSTNTTTSGACLQEHQSGCGGGGGAVSPAARFASIEKTKTPEWKRSRLGEMGMVNEEIELISSKVERVSNFPSILSPNPSSLPPIPSTFFSPPSSSYDANLLGFFSDLSPMAPLHSSKNYIEGGGSSILLPSPSGFIISPQMISPNLVHQALDLFNSLFD